MPTCYTAATAHLHLFLSLASCYSVSTIYPTSTDNTSFLCSPPDSVQVSFWVGASVTVTDKVQSEEGQVFAADKSHVAAAPAETQGGYTHERPHPAAPGSYAASSCLSPSKRRRVKQMSKIQTPLPWETQEVSAGGVDECCHAVCAAPPFT